VTLKAEAVQFFTAPTFTNSAAAASSVAAAASAAIVLASLDGRQRWRPRWKSSDGRSGYCVKGLACIFNEGRGGGGRRGGKRREEAAALFVYC
jgi:hypothetical protein